MTQFLVDTNVVLWLAEDKPRIEHVKPLLLTTDSQVFVSVVSWWEIAIKVRAGKLTVDLAQIRSYAGEHAFIELPVTGEFMKAYLELPALHKDPFDHMLLAQAITSPMRLVTGDPFLAEYSSLVMVV